MKSVFGIRLFVASLFLSFLLPSLSYSQTPVQMDSMYAAMQRAVLREYPTAMFPPIPYDIYDTSSTEFTENRIDRRMGPVGDAAEQCVAIFPEFEAWDIYAADNKNDQLKTMYVTATFYLVDPENGDLMSGRASKVLIHKKKKKATDPDQFELTDYDDGTAGVSTAPFTIMSYDCEPLQNCLGADNPIAQLAAQYCASLQSDEGEEW